MAYTMKDAAEVLGISVPLIRRYEQEFELSFQRNEQGRCILTETDVENLRLILAKRADELPVDEIRSMLVQRSEPEVETTTLVPADAEVQPPGVREVMQAMLDRLDQLEQLVIAQGSAIQRLGEENLRLLESGIPSSSPSGAVDDRIKQLERDVAEARRAQDESIRGKEDMRKLQRRLLELEATVATQTASDEDQDERLLDEIARALQAQSRPPRPWWKFW